MGQCYNSTIVNAPVDEVWTALKNFHDMSWAPNVITSLEVMGDKGAGEIGARRKLNGAFANRRFVVKPTQSGRQHEPSCRRAELLLRQ